MNKTMVRSSWFLVGMLLPALVAAAPIHLTPAVSSRSADAAELWPGIVLDPSGNAIYSMNPHGGIDAVSPESGRLLWHTSEAAKPLAIHDGRLIAQGPNAGRQGILDIALIDVADGRRRQTMSMQLAEGIGATVDQSMGSTFEVRAVDLDGAPHLLWNHVRRSVRGVAPGPDENLEQERAGAFRMDLIGGLATAVDTTSLELAQTLPATVQQRVSSGELSTLPAPAGGVIAATRASSGRIVLERWRLNGQPLPDVDLFSRPYILELRSADGRHLMVAERAAPGEIEEYGWTIFSLESGEKLGQLRHQLAHAWFFIHGSKLIHIAPPMTRRVGDDLVTEPLRMRAILLDDGSVVWERTLRDTSFRGLFPP